MKKIILVFIIFSQIYLLCYGIEKPLVIGVLEYSPYIKKNDSDYSGLAVDIVNEAFNRMNKKTNFVLFPIARSLKMLDDGEIDGFFSIKKTAEREKNLIFPKEYLFSQDYVFFMKKKSVFDYNGTYDSIKNLRIGIVNTVSYGSRFDLAVKENYFSDLDYANNFESCFKKLANERVDIVICSKLVGLEIIKVLNLKSEIIISGPPSETAFSFIAFSNKKEHLELADSFDDAIKKMKKDGTMKKIQKRYSF